MLEHETDLKLGRLLLGHFLSLCSIHNHCISRRQCKFYVEYFVGGLVLLLLHQGSCLATAADSLGSISPMLWVTAKSAAWLFVGQLHYLCLFLQITLMPPPLVADFYSCSWVYSHFPCPSHTQPDSPHTSVGFFFLTQIPLPSTTILSLLPSQGQASLLVPCFLSSTLGLWSVSWVFYIL